MLNVAVIPVNEYNAVPTKPNAKKINYCNIANSPTNQQLQYELKTVAID